MLAAAVAVVAAAVPYLQLSNGRTFSTTPFATTLVAVAADGRTTTVLDWPAGSAGRPSLYTTRVHLQVTTTSGR